jgi:energy-coupling factor transporter transmembrane protein EcfT
MDQGMASVVANVESSEPHPARSSSLVVPMLSLLLAASGLVVWRFVPDGPWRATLLGAVALSYATLVGAGITGLWARRGIRAWLLGGLVLLPLFALVMLADAAAAGR